jgi:UDP-galactopyranose mutase
MVSLVVGAGFAGATCARRIAESGERVVVVDRRPHIAGNAYDHLDAHGVLVHAYGPHIFHTNSQRVVEFLSRFTAWRPYEHRVLAAVYGQLLPIPINRTTINRLYGLGLDEAGVQNFLEQVREPRAERRGQHARRYRRSAGER